MKRCGVTAFQERVYGAVRRIPRGRVTTYGRLAAHIGCRCSRAVGQALRRNPFAPRVPCHRVIASDLTLGGFSGAREGKAIRRKQALLAREGVLFMNGRLADPAVRLYGFAGGHGRPVTGHRPLHPETSREVGGRGCGEPRMNADSPSARRRSVSGLRRRDEFPGGRIGRVLGERAFLPLSWAIVVILCRVRVWGGDGCGSEFLLVTHLDRTDLEGRDPRARHSPR